MNLALESSTVSARFRGRIGSLELDAALTLSPRSATALTGPSGSGKTTMLRCIAGLSRISGRVTVGGDVWQDDLTFIPAHRRSLGVVFQDGGLLSHLSVHRNIVYGAARTHGPHHIQFSETVDLLGLEPLLKRSIKNLSAGERQRVALGRALMAQPRLLLMDEPLSSLDVASKIEILPYLERLHRTLSIPILYISHDPDEVARLADRVLVMRAGRIVREHLRGERQKNGFSEIIAAEETLDSLDAEHARRLALAAILAGLAPTEPSPRSKSPPE